MTDMVTAEELAAALPHVLAAPATAAPVHLLCTRPARNQRQFAPRIVLRRRWRRAGRFRDAASRGPKLEDGSPDPRIQVSILPLRVLDLVWRDRAAVAHPGDTIIADLNTSEEALPAGCLIRAGTAVLRVSDIWNRGCAKWRGRYGNAAYAWTSNPDHKIHRLRGILCAIEQDGEVAVGDSIERV
jgi:hypothetical protein